MSKTTIIESLKEFGLTQKEAEIYIFLAKHGVLTGGQIAKQTKTHRGLVYRILKSLQKKGVVESTMESPIRYSPVSFEKILNENIRIKKEEAISLEKEKNQLLSDWEKINIIKIQPSIGKFVVLEGKRKIFSKISEMISQTKNQFSATLTVTGFLYTEQLGVLDTIYGHPSKSWGKFQLLTDLSIQNLNALKLIRSKLKPGINLRVKDPNSSFVFLPRMVIRDNVEALFFVSPKSEIFNKNQDQSCIYTNNASLILTLTSMFKELWKNSMNPMPIRW